MMGMNNTKNTQARLTLIHRIAAGAVLAMAPGLIALGCAANSHAEAATTTTGPSVSSSEHHVAFPNQHDVPQPGSRVHHHHQWNHAK